MSAAPSRPWKQKLLDTSQRESFVLWSLLSFAFLLRAICAWRMAVIFNDGPIFLAIAEEMGMGRWETAFSYDYHPLYSFLIYLFSGREIDPAFTGVLISIVAGSLAVPVLYVLLRQIWDREVATLGAGEHFGEVSNHVPPYVLKSNMRELTVFRRLFDFADRRIRWLCAYCVRGRRVLL